MVAVAVSCWSPGEGFQRFAVRSHGGSGTCARALGVAGGDRGVVSWLGGTQREMGTVPSLCSWGAFL